MSTDVGSARQAEQFNEKLDTIIATATRANAVKAGDNLNNFSSTFLRNWYERMEDMDYENFKSQFIEDAKLETESTGLSTEGIDYEGIADNLREMKPIFIEELGIDHFTVDEAHNYKNIFEKAKMEEDSIGNKDINRYGDIKGASSKA
ncbi:MAG: hypothetical protein LBG59_07510 [Candidatus Peribacteria bacterium]|jgi:N12 class adenine-specific DNA methylase|nr:hypothetical protein [Candidatus Peribacteria bacterium]